MMYIKHNNIIGLFSGARLVGDGRELLVTLTNGANIGFRGPYARRCWDLLYALLAGPETPSLLLWNSLVSRALSGYDEASDVDEGPDADGVEVISG